MNKKENLAGVAQFVCQSTNQATDLPTDRPIALPINYPTRAPQQAKRRTIRKVMGEEDRTFFSLQEFFHVHYLCRSLFFRGKSPVRGEGRGGLEGEMFCWCNLNLDTLLNLNAWNRLQLSRTKMFLTFTQSFCFSVKIVLRENMNKY